MPTSAQKIPNRPLDGEEVKTLTLMESVELIDEIGVSLQAALKTEMERNQLFTKQYGHPRVRIELTAKFHWSNINIPKKEIAVSAESSPAPKQEDANHYIAGIRREIEIDNPNLTRAHLGLPISVTEVKRPGPNEQFGTIEHIPVSINAADYPEPTPPRDTDISDSVAGEKKIPRDRRIGRNRD